MSEIKVDLDSLGYLSGSFRGLSDTVSSAKTYQSSYVNLNLAGEDSALASGVRNQAKKVEDALAVWISDTEKATSAAADCVDGCIHDYQKNEQETVTTFEGHYTASDAAGARTGASSTATGKLTTPTNRTDFEKVFNAMGMVGNVVSPSYWLGTLADKVVDLIVGQGEHDPFAAVGSKVAGDWKKVSRASDALSKLSGYFNELSTETKDFWNKVDPDWDGGASDDANTSLGKMGTSFSDVSKRLTELSKAYNAVAVGVYNTADTITGLLRTISDEGIAALASAAIGTATAETVIGAVAGYTIAGLEVYNLIKAVKELFKVLGNSWNIVTTFTGVTSMTLGLSHGSGGSLTIHNPSFSE